jgi:hypothetical protein
MSAESNGKPLAIDLIRWTFTCDPVHRAAIEEHLNDQGFDVLVRDGSQFLVTWDEPDREVEEVISELWELNEAPFEVTQDDFQRLALHTLQPADDDEALGAA